MKPLPLHSGAHPLGRHLGRIRGTAFVLPNQGCGRCLGCRDPHFLCCGEVPSVPCLAPGPGQRRGTLERTGMALLPSDSQAWDSSGLRPRDPVLVPIGSWLTCSLPWFPWCKMKGQAPRPLMVLRYYCSRDFSHPSYPRCLNFLRWA